MGPYLVKRSLVCVWWVTPKNSKYIKLTPFIASPHQGDTKLVLWLSHSVEGWPINTKLMNLHEARVPAGGTARTPHHAMEGIGGQAAQKYSTLWTDRDQSIYLE